MPRRINRPSCFDMVMFTTVDSQRIAVYQERGIKTRAARTVDNLAVNDFDINQGLRPFRWKS